MNKEIRSIVTNLGVSGTIDFIHAITNRRGLFSLKMFVSTDMERDFGSGQLLSLLLRDSEFRNQAKDELAEFSDDIEFEIIHAEYEVEEDLDRVRMEDIFVGWGKFYFTALVKDGAINLED